MIEAAGTVNRSGVECSMLGTSPSKLSKYGYYLLCCCVLRIVVHAIPICITNLSSGGSVFGAKVPTEGSGQESCCKSMPGMSVLE